MQDIVVVGAGLSGSLAAIMLNQRGFNVTVIDRHAVYPAEFRAEQLVGSQIDFLNNIGLTTNLISEAKIVSQARNFSLGKQLSSVFTSHYGMPYHDIVQSIRSSIPEGVRFIVGRVNDIESGPVSTVHLDDGQTIQAKLVVMATGLNTKLGKKLGVDYAVISERHSTAVGFDIRSAKCAPDETAVLVYYGNDLHDGIDYLTIFPCKDVLRGNLFLYRAPDDPWLRRLRQAPHETLLEALPALADELGEFTIEHVQCRTIDVAVAKNIQRDGIVLIGDAFQTSCPAAGTGISRLLVDVERLTIHAAKWLAANDTSASSLQSFYTDPAKRRSDRAALRTARFRRAISMDTSPFWAFQRQNVKARRFVKHVLYAMRGMMARPAQPMPQRPAEDRGMAPEAWLSWSRHAASAAVAPVLTTPDGASGAS